MSDYNQGTCLKIRALLETIADESNDYCESDTLSLVLAKLIEAKKILHDDLPCD